MRHVISALSLGLALAAGACDSDPAKRPLGATCDEPTQCQSNLCIQNLCIDPVGCSSVFASETQAALVNACMTGLQTLVIAPLQSTTNPGGQVQFQATGTFGSADVDPQACVSLADCPQGQDCRSTADGMRCVPFGSGPEAALTAAATAELTALVTWSSSGEQMVVFSSATPGLARVSPNASGTFLIRATLTKGDRTLFGETTLSVRASDVPLPN